MVRAVKEHLPAEVWLTLSPVMYLSFWSLSLYDISVPTVKYESELKRLRERSKLLLLSALPAHIGIYFPCILFTSLLLLHEDIAFACIFFYYTCCVCLMRTDGHMDRQLNRQADT